MFAPLFLHLQCFQKCCHQQILLRWKLFKLHYKVLHQSSSTLDSLFTALGGNCFMFKLREKSYLCSSSLLPPPLVSTNAIAEAIAVSLFLLSST